MSQAEIVSLAQLLRKVCPDLAARVDQRTNHFHIDADGNEPHLWMEQLAGATNTLMESGNEAELKAVFDLASARFSTGSTELKRLIDVGFVENLFWRVSNKGCTLGWQLLPKNLKTLYVEFHGQPPI